jgi:hypothetical protein
VTVDNTIIYGWRVTNGIVVKAKNVTIRNSWITSSFGTGLAVSGTGVINVHPGYSADIEHNLLDGLNGTHACVWNEGSIMTAKFNLCQNTNDGMFSWTTTAGVDGNGDNFRIEDNYFHKFSWKTSITVFLPAILYP